MKITESSPNRDKNTVGKGEIARYEQFSFFHSVFKRLVLQTRKNQGLFGKGLSNVQNPRFRYNLGKINSRKRPSYIILPSLILSVVSAQDLSEVLRHVIANEICVK